MLLSVKQAFSQNIFNTILKDSQSKELLIGVIAGLKGTGNAVVSDEGGEIILANIPSGRQIIRFSYLGYRTLELELDFPLSQPVEVVFLSPSIENELGEVIVQGTRSNRSIAQTPTRVEVLTEEIDEAATMDPSKIAHLLTHSTGIQVQQTSATSNTANVRIQGLDGRYTQILKDGFPLYGGFSGSLSIMQIPPLDLRQIEYIKGGASTLYGGGAIAGIINVISKEPTSEETILHLNGSQIGAFDVNMFTSKKYEKIGFTL
jgi:iron complex outermembrane receptor protein